MDGGAFGGLPWGILVDPDGKLEDELRDGEEPPQQSFLDLFRRKKRRPNEGGGGGPGNDDPNDDADPNEEGDGSGRYYVIADSSVPDPPMGRGGTSYYLDGEDPRDNPQFADPNR